MDSMTPNERPSMASRVKDGVFLLLLAFTVGAGVHFGLVRHHELPEVVFDGEALSDPSPFRGDLYALTQLVRQRYAYLEYRQESGELDLEALEAEALDLLGSGEDEEAFRRAARRYVAGLHDGHAYVQFPEPRLPSPRHWPFSALLVKEGVMVDGVHPDAVDQLARGDLVLTVDGMPVDERIEQATRIVFASTDAARRHNALDWMTTWSEEEEIRLSILRPGEGEFEVTLPCPLRRLSMPTPGKLSTEREVRGLAEDVAYFRPGNFSAPGDSGFAGATPAERDEILLETQAEYARIFSTFGEARTLILDLRGNPGGTDLLGQALVGHLMEPGPAYSRLSSQGSRGWTTPSPTYESRKAPAHRFSGRLLCLIDAGTFSVADNVAACLRDRHGAVTFVGENTGAGSGAPRSFPLPRTGTLVTFCTMRVFSPEGRIIEGVGTAPDVLALRTREDVLAGRDTALEAARAHL